MADGKDTKAAIVDAMMKLAATRRFEDIAIRDIAAEAGVSLADFRDAFPSKGAVLAAFSRRIDRAVLATPLGELAASSARDRLFDVLMRRLDAMAPYRDALARDFRLAAPRSRRADRNEPAHRQLHALHDGGGGDRQRRAGGALKLQGLALAWARVFAVWLDDTPPDFSKTMAALDRELTRGERLVAGVDRLERFAAPLRSLAEAGLRRREDVRRRRP